MQEGKYINNNKYKFGTEHQLSQSYLNDKIFAHSGKDNFNIEQKML